MQSRIVMVVCSLAAAVGLAGCGTGPGASSPVSTPRPATSNMAGNWLLLGSLPQTSFFTTTPQLSVTLTTVGDQIVGTGHASTPCPASPGTTGFVSGLGYSFVATGAAASDGSFTLASSPISTVTGIVLPTVQISGMLPAAAGGVWTGAYTLDTTGNADCSQKISGALTSTPIAPINGTYVASGTLTQGAVVTPFTMTMTLQQGSLSTTAAGQTVDDAAALAGSVVIKGLSCFSTGSIVPVPTGSAVQRSVQGAMTVPEFTMDDGSLLVLNSYIHDAAASQLDSGVLFATKGGCGTPSGSQLRTGNFLRQN